MIIRRWPVLDARDSFRHASVMNRLGRINRNLVVTASLVIALHPCAPYRVEYIEDALRQATQTELVHKFGYPQRLKRVKNGDQVWEYDFQRGETECVRCAITFNMEDELRQWERRDCPKTHSGSKRQQ